jgi:hypothetical protein
VVRQAHHEIFHNQDASMTPQKTLAHDAWSPFQPRELAQRLEHISRPWCIVGGWALDLWHGHETREHEDIEFTVLRGDVSLFRQALSDLEFYATGSGVVDYLPDGQEPPADIFQIWCRTRRRSAGGSI